MKNMNTSFEFARKYKRIAALALVVASGAVIAATPATAPTEQLTPEIVRSALMADALDAPLPRLVLDKVFNRCAAFGPAPRKATADALAAMDARHRPLEAERQAMLNEYEGDMSPGQWRQFRREAEWKVADNAGVESAFLIRTIEARGASRAERGQACVGLAGLVDQGRFDLAAYRPRLNDYLQQRAAARSQAK